VTGEEAENGGASGADASLGGQDEEALEIFVDGSGGVELGEFREEFGGEVSSVIGKGREDSRELLAQMADTKTGFGVRGLQAASSGILIAVWLARRRRADLEVGVPREMVRTQSWRFRGSGLLRQEFVRT
jgi:hypothetical protein